MTQTDDRQITPDLTHTAFEVLKAIPKGHVFMNASEPGTWRYHNGRDGFVVTATMRSLFQKQFVRAKEDFVDGRRGADITPAGYIAMSKATHHKPTKRRR
jgi:hypothetical protein